MLLRRDTVRRQLADAAARESRRVPAQIQALHHLGVVVVKGQVDRCTPLLWVGQRVNKQGVRLIKQRFWKSHGCVPESFKRYQSEHFF